jgi:DNA polymerase-4
VSQLVLHVDMDQFIAAVEVQRDPSLRGKPVVVGGDGDPNKRGVVSTASYEAREFGVRSGLPLRTAAKRCPDCVFLPVDADAYNEVSARVMAVLRESGCPVEVLGWDEAFVGTDSADPEGFARGLAADVKAATDLDCSVGIGDNKLQAKIATGFGKPAGVSRLTAATWFEVLGDRPPDAIWGIGAKTVAKLAALGITTVRQLAAADPAALAKEFGPMTGPWLVLLGNGRGESEVDSTPYIPRSHGREVTYQRNLADWTEVAAEVARLARQVAAEVTDRPVARVVVKVRYAPFDTVTHGTSLPPGERFPPGTAPPPGGQLALGGPPAGTGPAQDGERWAATFERAAGAALATFTPGRPVRLLGVRAEFADNPDLPGPAHPDLRQRGVRGQRLAFPGRAEPAPLVQPAGRLVGLGHPQEQRAEVARPGPGGRRLQERLAGAEPPGRGAHPHGHEVGDPVFDVDAGEPGGRQVGGHLVSRLLPGEERDRPLAAEPAAPRLAREGGFPRVRRREGVGRVRQRGEPHVAQWFPVVRRYLTHQDHALMIARQPSRRRANYRSRARGPVEANHSRAGYPPTCEVSQSQKSALAVKSSLTLAAGAGVDSHGSGFQCRHVVSPLCRSRPIRGWSTLYPRGADLSVPCPCTSTPSRSRRATIAASSAPSGPATPARY